MGSIYSCASMVLAWLGAASHNSDQAMDFLSKLGDVGANISLTSSQERGSIDGLAFTRHTVFDNHVQWLGDEEIWDAVKTMFCRPYWNRVWII